MQAVRVSSVSSVYDDATSISNGIFLAKHIEEMKKEMIKLKFLPVYFRMEKDNSSITVIKMFTRKMKDFYISTLDRVLPPKRFCPKMIILERTAPWLVCLHVPLTHNMSTSTSLINTKAFHYLVS